MPIHERVICSSISLRHRPLDEALTLIEDQGFAEIDLGALPGVCDHVPSPLTATAVEEVTATLAGHELSVASVNADVGDLNLPVDDDGRRARREHLDALLRLCRSVRSPALVLPCGWPSHEPADTLDTDLDRVADALRAAADQAADAGVELWVEAQHSLRLCWSTDRAGALMDRLDGDPVGVVLDFSHVVAAGDDLTGFVDRLGERVRHVHLRDAVPGDIHLSIGHGHVDFAAGLSALTERGYAGRFALELETHDVTEADRPDTIGRAGAYVSTLLETLA